MICCDTNVLIELFDRKAGRNQETVSYLEAIGMDNLVASAASLMEIIKGVRNREHRQQLSKKLNIVHFFPLTPSITTTTVMLLDTYRLAYGLDILDALIAATAIELDTKLFTYNIKDFHFIRELELYAP